MKIKVVYVWDSETNAYSPDSESVDVVVQPSADDRMLWNWTKLGRNSKTGSMGLTRGFEMLMYLAGLASDAGSKATAKELALTWVSEATWVSG